MCSARRYWPSETRLPAIAAEVNSWREPGNRVPKPVPWAHFRPLPALVPPFPFPPLRGLPRSGIGPSGEHTWGAQYTTARWPACGRCSSQSPQFPPSWHHQHGSNQEASAAQLIPPLCVRIGGAEDMEAGTALAPPYPPMLSVDATDVYWYTTL